MAELKVGTRVKVTGKDVQGVIAFIGPTNFALDTWIGVKLTEPKGKNNGTVQGVEYFSCEDKCGLFVKPSQVVALDDHGKPLGGDDPKPRRQSSFGARPKPTTSRLSLASSRQSLADSRQSLAGSRHSLAGSRQSLMGSRSHLTSPVVEKSDTPSDSQIPKRAAFVETGFVETLKPQYTPGQVLTPTPTPITSLDEKINHLQWQQEMENRNQQIRDLDEKLKTLKIKREEDREKLREFEKLELQRDQLVEFKSKIMEAQASLQRELQRAKQQAKDAIEAKETHAEEVADLAEAVEMATLDREMAEEKAETLQLELEVCKEKLEEVTLDLKILKTEMQQRGDGGSAPSTAVDKGGEVTNFEVKQLQQQNARLRETLVRLRDLSAHDKHEYSKLLKDGEQKKSEIVELGKTKEKLSAKVDEMEQQIADLQEQVDAALGAEEMVVLLGEQKLTLEETVTQLREEVADLEAIQDMNDELVESNAELEAELREDLDLAQAATRQAMRDRDAALETIADREATINKFRDLVQKLQEQSLDLQHRLEKETSKPVSALPEILDFKKMFTETKAHTKAIDLELRRVDIQQLQSHIRYLTSYMPETFMNRGGDHDAVLVLLLIPRMIHKSEILLGQIRDKFGNVEKIDRATILKGHAVEQFSFRCRCSYYIYALQCILHQYFYALNNCDSDALLKVGATYPEMAAQEKIIDSFVELVKRDQLDENIPTESLEKCVVYFNTLFPVLLASENCINHTQLVGDSVKCLGSACDGMNNDALVIRNLIETANVGDIGLLAQHIISTIEQLQGQLKLIKRRLPADPNISNIGLNREIFEILYQCYQHSGKIIKTLQDIVKTSIQTMTISGELEKGLPQDKIKEIALNASDKIYEQDDLGPVQSIKNSLHFLTTQIAQLSQFLQDNEYEISTAASKNAEKPIPPIQLRAENVKKEMKQTKTLTLKLGNKESDIKELRKALKEKQEQLSEMTIRKELAEKKLGNVNKDYEMTIEKLQRKLEEATNNYRKKEKEFEETLDHLQTDIDALENEKGEMKEKLKLISKKTQMELSMTKSGSGSQLSSLSTSLGPSLPAVVRDSPLLLQEIDNLRKLFHQERNERIKLESDALKRKLDSLRPLPILNSKADERLEYLCKEGKELKRELLMALAKPKFPAIYKVQPGNGPAAWKRHFVEENDRFMDMKRRGKLYQVKVAEEVVRRSMGGKVEADFAVFPTVEMTKAFEETKAVNVGYVKIPMSGLKPGEKSNVVNLDLDYQNLHKVLQSLSSLI